MPKLNFGLSFDFSPRAGTTVAGVLDAIVPIINQAERHGFTSCFTGENFPVRNSYFSLPSPILVLAALAPRTSLRLGTGVTMAPLWHPLRLAYDTAVLDQITNGRFTLGVALGHAPDMARFGIDEKSAGDRMDDIVGAVRALWSGKGEFTGKTLSVSQPIAPLPVQAGGPPMWFGGMGPRTARRVAQHGEAWFAATMYHLGDIARQVAANREQMTATGRDPSTVRVAVNRLTVVSNSTQRALEESGKYVEKVIRTYASFGAMTGHANPDDPASEIVPLTPDSDRILERVGEMCLIGSPDSIIPTLSRYADAGVTDIQLRLNPGEIPFEQVSRTVELVGREIIPHFQ
ncbi:Flavin-dependent trigonelline monooxygenase, oxygenase component [Cupriavidus laharis]|uniref:Flavin-dependent trigonelline monooxygenase, oxygenase component n=1 Tax=Cupriavidus laharis TaxID=151654 RepID=A0ABN7YPG9_9BURK|nr:LLM class flavin-dependent oxidoreductase [Cupriavidus laharis]CAG9173427.1 Flavin-dependent trigonelline monooxygenase, oxygenase component [Cupriavidus laharis]